MRYLILLALFLAGPSLHAQAPTLPGQDAYAAIAEVARILEGDRATDWSKVRCEPSRGTGMPG